MNTARLQTALITGASSGIGLAFAEQLAQQHKDLVLTARSADKLDALAQRLTQDYGIKAWAFPCDLVEPDAATRIAEAIAGWGLTIDLLVNNAGFGEYGAFDTCARDRHLNMIQLNIAALVDLTYQFLPGMRARQSGAIVNVSSIAGFQPMPYLATYAATKAFVLSFSESLWAEAQADKVQVVALCPGPTETSFFKEAKFPTELGDRTPNGLASPEEVVRDALDAINSNTPTVVSGGLLNHIIVNLSRFLPRPTLVNTLEKQFRPPTSSG
ncbi:MAG: SDR family oxidoreductase [Elainellaceae cyanobacterium]